MKTVYCFILLFYICYCVEDSGDPKDYWKNLHDGLYRSNIRKNNDHQRHGYNHSSIIQPCHFDDLTCIRRVFAQNSKCKPVEGPAPDPYMMQRLDLAIPQANLTFSLLNAQVKGLNEWKIKIFYINKATDRLVLEVVFDRIVVASPGARTTCHRKGKEPVEITDYSIIEYCKKSWTKVFFIYLKRLYIRHRMCGFRTNNIVFLDCDGTNVEYDAVDLDGISFTLTIPNIKDLQLAKGHVFTYVADANPLYTLGPAVKNEKDAEFIKSVAVWLDILGISMQEVWETQGPAFMSMFLHSNICDFRQN